MEQERPSFWFWFATEAFFALIVTACLYYFFIKNPKINPPRKKRDEPQD